MHLIPSDPAPGYPVQSNSWDAVRYWSGMAERFQRASLASQVMAGFCLLELRDSHGVQPGKRTDLATSPNDSERLNWSDLVKKEAGISDDTARNWMKMAKAVKAKWAKLPIRDRLRALMSAPPSAWQEDDNKLISDAVHKITDGVTQMEFMFSLGLASRPIGHGLNKKPVSAPSKDIAIAEPEDEEQDELILGIEHDMRLLSATESPTLKNCSSKFLAKHLAAVDAYARHLRSLLAARERRARSNTIPSTRPRL